MLDQFGLSITWLGVWRPHGGGWIGSNVGFRVSALIVFRAMLWLYFDVMMRGSMLVHLYDIMRVLEYVGSMNAVVPLGLNVNIEPNET